MNEGRLTRYYGPWELDKMLLILEPGDLIEFDRGAYKHWAVYLGEFELEDDKPSPCVVHRNNQDAISLSAISNTFRSTHSLAKTCTKGLVALQSLKDVIDRSKFRINNTFDSKSSPYSKKSIQLRLLDKAMETGNSYDLVTNNCEHFAKWARNGISKSNQVDNVVTSAGLGVGIGILGALVGFGVNSLMNNRRRNY